MLARQGGDTMVEVIIAFAVFTLVSVGAITVMNRGVTVTERSLEITLVREQIDAQAEILRFARDTQSPVWNTIRAASTNTVPTIGCATPPSEAFIAGANGGAVTYSRFSSVAGSFLQPTTYSQFTLDASPKAYGMWVVPVRVSSDSYDMYIQACWYAPGDDGSNDRTSIGTIVRLYES